MKEKKFLLYKITCLLNNKIYVGQHRTFNENDGYFGSGGKLYKEDLKKFGKENFIKEIIRYCNNEFDLDEWEAKIVDEEFVARSDTYNYQVGGQWELSKWSEAGNRAKKEKLLNDPEFAKAISEKCRIRAVENNYGDHFEGYTFDWTGKKHKEESKKKIGIANSIHQQGSKNSQYGTCWIYNEDLKQNKRIKKEELYQWLELGWIKGRKIKNI